MNVQSAVPATSIELERAVLDALMPLHLILGPEGEILRLGPTARKLFGDKSVVGEHFLDVFEVRRPRPITRIAVLWDHLGAPWHVALRNEPRIRLRGIAVPIAEGGATALLNLTFGVHVADAVSRYDLTMDDFAPTDLTIEMLYLMEARGLAMEQAKKLIQGLDKARITAVAESATDPLTGLPNRRGLDHYLESPHMKDAGLSLMVIDLDLFKKVNDTHGHAAGDHVLKTIAARLRHETRPGDFIARVGGDEFVLIFDRLTDLNNLERTAKRVIKAIGKAVEFEGHSCEIGASAGLSLRVSETELRFNDLFKAADKALYRAKSKGRGRSEFEAPGDISAVG